MNCNLPYTKLAFALLAVASFFLPPCYGEDKSGSLKSTISKSVNLPQIDADLSSGHSFDQGTALAKLGGNFDDDDWHKIPSWMGESWHIDRNVPPVAGEVMNTEEGSKLQVAVMAFAIVPPPSYSTGHYTDAKGQTWEYSVPPHWEERSDDKYKHHILVLEPQIVESTDKSYGTIDKRIEFIVEPDTGKIVKILQHSRQETRYILAREPIYNRQNSRTSVILQTYDERGDLLRTSMSQAAWQSPGRIVADSSLKLADGRSLFEMFNNYLKKNGMSDRLPQVAVMTEQLPYLTTGQMDYSKQKRIPDESQLRALATRLATTPRSADGVLSGIVEAVGTQEATTFRITDLKGIGPEINVDKLTFKGVEYEKCERKIGARAILEVTTMLNSLHMHPSPSSQSQMIGPGETTLLEFKQLTVDQLVTEGLLKPKSH